MADSDNDSSGGQGGSEFSPKEQDRFLPIANVSRIMKKAKETVQECVSEFISFVTGEASDKCQREKRKTVNGDDLLWAMTTLGFEEYVEPLKIYLQKFRETEGEKTSVGRGEGGKDISFQNSDGGVYSQNGFGGGGGVYSGVRTTMVGRNQGGMIYEHAGRIAGGYQIAMPGKLAPGGGPSPQPGQSRG